MAKLLEENIPVISFMTVGNVETYFRIKKTVEIISTVFLWIK